MNLQEFIKESLTQIARGVNDANQEFKAECSIAEANPTHRISPSKQLEMTNLYQIEFDVAVTVENEVNHSEGKLKVASFANSDSTTKSHLSHSMASRLKFTIPMILPYPPK